MSAQLPEIGQLVQVRRRQWVVTDTATSALQEGTEGGHHLISLNSIEDDGQGDELRVIWEREPGAHILEASSWPTVGERWDEPALLDTFLDAVRWGGASLSDRQTLNAPFRSGIQIEDYQLEPLVRAVQMPRVNLLVADAVGLGKTIEAGLVNQELITRGRARNTLILCPSALQIQWRDQMRDKFGLEFRIVDAQLMRDLRRTRGLHVNPWTHFPRLITSYDYLKRDRPLRLLTEILPAKGQSRFPRRFGLLIVDEAHNVAPSGRGKYAIDSQRTRAVRLLAPHFEHKLFLTATPHNGYQESFTALLELLDDQRFARGLEPDPRQLATVLVRRMKSDIVAWDGRPRFPGRTVIPMEVTYSDDERQAHAWLREYTALRAAHPTDDQERYATEFVTKLLKKRLFSSPAAFRKTLEQHLETLQTARKKTASAPSRPAVRLLRQHLEDVEEEYASDADYAEAEDDATARATQLFRPLADRERQLLDNLRAWAETARHRPDSKAATLLAWLEALVRPNGEWSNERVIVFTEYRDTQAWLFNLLASQGLTGQGRTELLYGGMESVDRERIKAAFQASPAQSPVRILLATDAASEGIDLQLHCHRLVHLEIPWNPNRLEQRNGRVDRHGQRHPVEIRHFAPAGYATAGEGGALEADLEFLRRVIAKVEQIREDLGKVGPVIAAQVEEAMLGRRSQLDTAAAEGEGGAVRRLLKVERDIQKAVRAHAQQLRETRSELRLEPARVVAAVRTALALAGQPALIPVAVDDLPAGSAFALPALSGSWARCAEGLAHPHTGTLRPLVFDHALAAGRDDVVLAHLNHRLVQMALRLLRAEIWTRGAAARLSRVTARITTDESVEGPLVVAHGRLIVTGARGHRLHEELLVAGGVIDQGRFRRLGLERIKAGLAAATDQAPPAALVSRLAAVWPGIQAGVARALDARQGALEGGVFTRLEKLYLRDRDDLTAILDELQRAIEHELEEQAQTPDPQLAFDFAQDEREQYQADVEALRRRLAALPDERARELQALAERYDEPAPRLFPVALTLLVPARLAQAEGGAP